MNATWDWVYTHHGQLLAVIAIATIALAATAIAAARRRSFWHGIAWTLTPGVVIVVAVATWIVADRRSNASDIERRVRNVTSVLPNSSRRLAAGSGDNFRTETYSVDGDTATIAAQMAAAAQARLAPAGHIYVLPPQGNSPPDIEVAFGGRNGCDGTVEVWIHFASTHSATTIDLNGHCED